MTDTVLGDLLAGHAQILTAGAGALPVRGLTADSRKVQPGFLFVCVPGTHVDGTRYIPQALAAGAGAILMEPTGTPPDLPAGVDLAFTLDARASLAYAAARFYPRQPGTIAAVTGRACGGRPSASPKARFTCPSIVSASLATRDPMCFAITTI
eukprot:gene12352-15092_t